MKQLNLDSSLMAITIMSTIGAIFCFVSVCLSFNKRASDSFVRDQVVLLTNGSSQCTGFRVISPSKKIYTMTARHCAALTDSDNQMTALSEQGKVTKLNVLEEAFYADIMLLNSDGNDGLLIADKVTRYDKVHKIAHGGGVPSFRADGVFLVEDAELMIMDNILHVEIGTVRVIPGDSGGPVVNENGAVVGVVTRYDGNAFSFYSTLDDIREFLKNR